MDLESRLIFCFPFQILYPYYLLIILSLYIKIFILNQIFYQIILTNNIYFKCKTFFNTRKKYLLSWCHFINL